MVRKVPKKLSEERAKNGRKGGLAPHALRGFQTLAVAQRIAIARKGGNARAESLKGKV